MKMYAAVQLTDNTGDADALLALQSKMKKNAKIQAAAKSHIPIYVTKSLVQITKAIRALMNSQANGLKGSGTEEDTKLSDKIMPWREAACDKKNKTSAAMIETPETQEEILYLIELF
ncbi:hypothetical protein NC651_026922 [Populus alba x Populus x berolinensis]|nr:hypothetical protein NC651_026922 [Populus alba x Populus x berolinensis]